MEKEKTGNLFIKRPKLAIVISLAIMLAGMLMITALPLEEYPSITPPQVVVTAIERCRRYDLYVIYISKRSISTNFIF